MSRIDEALKRAAKGPVERTDIGGFSRDRFALAVKPGVRVDDYATEQESPLSEVRETPHLHDRLDRATVERAIPERSLPLSERPAVKAAPNSPRPKASSSFLAHVPEVVEGKLVSLKGTDPTSVEQYRRLASTIHGLQQQSGIKVLMVTSSVPKEGKSLTSANLALTLSQSYNRRVLLIDGDLRRPFIHEIFGLPNAAGLGDGLRGDGTSLTISSVAPRLTILPAGRPDSDPMAGLASERMHAILKEASERFDWVILDTPPVGLISDANLMAGFVDGVIFVIGANTTNYQLVERAINEIGRDRIIGTVLNRVEHETTPASGYYDHYYDETSDGTE